MANYVVKFPRSVEVMQKELEERTKEGYPNWTPRAYISCEINIDLFILAVLDCENSGIMIRKTMEALVLLPPWKHRKYKNVEVTAISTAGVRTNSSKAGDPASYWQENGEFHFGTINTILLTNVNLSKSTLVEAFMCATEAKTVAMNNLKIPSQYSNGYATGTGTDGLCIFSNTDSDDVITNAGKHSKMGELIAKAVIESVTKAIGKQVWITNKSQANVLVRLNRYSLDINDFYNDLDYDKFQFISKLQKDMKKPENVAIATSVLNLFDEVDCGLINKKEAFGLAKKIVDENCNSYPIKELLNYWINYFIR